MTPMESYVTDPKPRTLGPFADYLNVAGPTRITVVKQHIAQIDRDRTGGFWTYKRASEGIRRAARADDPRPELQTMLEDAPVGREVHYRDLVKGMESFFVRSRYRAAPNDACPASWSHGRLVVNINHVLGLTDRAGKLHACFLYFKQPQLQPDTADAICRLIEQRMDNILPGGEAAALDIRRGKLMRRRRRRPDQDIDAWLESESLGYIALWDSLMQGKQAA